MLALVPPARCLGPPTLSTMATVGYLQGGALWGQQEGVCVQEEGRREQEGGRREQEGGNRRREAAGGKE